MLMEITYGHRVKLDDDFYVRIADQAIDETAKVGGFVSCLSVNDCHSLTALSLVMEAPS